MVPLVRADTAGTAETGGSGRLRSDSNLSSTGMAAAAAAAVVAVDGEREKVLPHPVEPRATTATLPPVLVCSFLFCEVGAREDGADWYGQSKTVDDDVLCWLGFTPDAILTSCKTGK